MSNTETRSDQRPPSLKPGSILLAICCSILALFTHDSTFNTQPLSTSFYVATNGDDSNPGTLSQPWRHVSYAASNSAVKAGDTVYIRGGVYHESIQQNIAGSQGKPTTYRNYPGETPIISDIGASGMWRWQVLDQSHLRIEGMTFRDYRGGAIQVRTIKADISNIEIANCTFENQHKLNGDASVALVITSYESGHYLHNITIRDNNFYNMDVGAEPGEAGEVLTAAGNVRDIKIIGNTIISSTNIGIDIIGRPDMGQPERVLIRGNRVSGHGSPGRSSAGIYLDGAGKYIIVEGNIIHDGLQGIKVNLETPANSLETRYVIVRRNVLYNNSQINLRLGVGGALSDCAQRGKLENTVAVHNTVFSELDDSINHSFGCGQDLRWKNNIFAHTSSNEGFQYKHYNETMDPSTWLMDYDYFYNSGGEKYYRWTGERYDSLASFKEASGQDQNSREGNPLFADVDNRDFRLQVNSLARDTGGPLAVTSNSGNGTVISVDEAWYFSDGFGLQDGDRIRVGNNPPITVVDVDYVNNEITVDRSISWENEDYVSYDYASSGPDIGACEAYSEIFLPLICAASFAPFLPIAASFLSCP